MVMRTKVTVATAVLMAGIVAAWPSTAQAQDHRLRISFGAATTAGSPDSQLALTGGIGYRFSQRLSFDIEATAFELPDDGGLPVGIAGAGGGGLARFDVQSPGIGGILGGQSRGGSGGMSAGGFNLSQALSTAFPNIRVSTSGETILATLGLRYEFPVQAGRLLPYVTAGLGAARTDRTVQYSVPTLQGLLNVRGAAPVRTESESSTRTGLAGSLGVGASLRVIAQLSLDVDARYFRLDGDRSLGRLGGGLSYRF